MKILNICEKYKFFIATAVLIPIVTVGYDAFENSSLFNTLT